MNTAYFIITTSGSASEELELSQGTFELGTAGSLPLGDPALLPVHCRLIVEEQRVRFEVLGEAALDGSPLAAGAEPTDLHVGKKLTLGSSQLEFRGFGAAKISPRVAHQPERAMSSSNGARVDAASIPPTVSTAHTTGPSLTPGGYFSTLGMPTAIAALLLIASWFFLPFVDMRLISFTFWKIQGFEPGQMLGEFGGGHGFFAYLGALCALAPLAVPFAAPKWRRHLLQLPFGYLFLMGLVGAIRFHSALGDLVDSLGPSAGEVAGVVGETLLESVFEVLAIGAFLLPTSALFLFVSSFVGVPRFGAVGTGGAQPVPADLEGFSAPSPRQRADGNPQATLRKIAPRAGVGLAGITTLALGAWGLSALFDSEAGIDGIELGMSDSQVASACSALGGTAQVSRAALTEKGLRISQKRLERAENSGETLPHKWVGEIACSLGTTKYKVALAAPPSDNEVLGVMRETTPEQPLSFSDWERALIDEHGEPSDRTTQPSFGGSAYVLLWQLEEPEKGAPKCSLQSMEASVHCPLARIVTAVERGGMVERTTSILVDMARNKAHDDAFAQLQKTLEPKQVDLIAQMDQLDPQGRLPMNQAAKPGALGALQEDNAEAPGPAPEATAAPQASVPPEEAKPAPKSPIVVAQECERYLGTARVAVPMTSRFSKEPLIAPRFSLLNLAAAQNACPFLLEGTSFTRQAPQVSYTKVNDPGQGVSILVVRDASPGACSAYGCRIWLFANYGQGYSLLRDFDSFQEFGIVVENQRLHLVIWRAFLTAPYLRGEKFEVELKRSGSTAQVLLRPEGALADPTLASAANENAKSQEPPPDAALSAPSTPAAPSPTPQAEVEAPAAAPAPAAASTPAKAPAEKKKKKKKKAD